MTKLVTILIANFLLAGVPVIAQVSPKTLEGSWQVMRAFDGEKLRLLSDDQRQIFSMSIEGTAIKFADGFQLPFIGKPRKGLNFSYIVHEKTSPLRFDFVTRTPESVKAIKVSGIAEFDKEMAVLRLCMSDNFEKYPKQFKNLPEEKIYLLELIRAPKPERRRRK